MRFFTSDFFLMNLPDSTAKNCGQVADFRKNWIAELRLRSNISLKSCGIAIAQVLPSRCGIAIADSKKVVLAHLCSFHSFHNTAIGMFAVHLLCSPSQGMHIASVMKWCSGYVTS
jgi:hypothetical protein